MERPGVTCLSYLAWKTRPKAPSPMSRTYWILFLGYSRARTLELTSRGTRWYMGFGWSRSRRSSDGRALRVGASIALRGERRGDQSGGRIKGPSRRRVSPLPAPPLFPASAAGEDNDAEEDRGGERCEDDDDDGHGVSWRRHGGRGKEVRVLTRS